MTQKLPCFGNLFLNQGFNDSFVFVFQTCAEAFREANLAAYCGKPINF